MSAIVIPPLPVSVPISSSGPPQLRRWTCAEFHDLAELGLFEGRGAMLIDGVILEEGPMNPPHATAIRKSTKVLEPIFAIGFDLRVQLPLVLSGLTDPHPDLAVVLGSYLDYAMRHPTMALLIVEISDTSLAYDQSDKASLYAAAGIADYWIVNLIDRRLEIRRGPVADPTQPHGFAYADVNLHGPNDSVSPLAAPQAQVRVADLLP